LIGQKWTVEVKNLDETIKVLGSWGNQAPKVAAAALYGIAEEVMTASKDIVPVDTGALKSTGHVQLPKISGPIVEVTLGYGGVAKGTFKSPDGKRVIRAGDEIGYGFYVHEDPTARHPSGQWKYLEEPLAAKMKDFDRLLAEAITELMALR